MEQCYFHCHLAVLVSNVVGILADQGHSPAVLVAVHAH